MKLSVDSLSKSYRKKTILKGLCLNANEGDIIGIIGANGSGKSTLLSVLSGVSDADSGSFIFEQNDFQKNDLFKNKKMLSKTVGFVPQNSVLIEELSGYDNLRLWYNSKEDLKSKTEDDVFSVLDLETFMHKTVSKMSGGMKKRISIACAVAGSPKILLLDEPSGALDLYCKERLYNYYKTFSSSGGIIILVTHDAQELLLCTKTFILQDGFLTPYIFDGDTQKLVGMISEGKI